MWTKGLLPLPYLLEVLLLTHLEVGEGEHTPDSRQEVRVCVR